MSRHVLKKGHSIRNYITFGAVLKKDLPYVEKSFIPGCPFTIASYAARVDTVAVPSQAMNKSIKAGNHADGYAAEGTAYPVVYLLHGYSGNYADWIKKAASTVRQADLYRIYRPP